MVFFIDAAKVSINDLENILETETPPQSPPPADKVNEEVFIEMVRESGTTTVKYHKTDDEKREPGEEESEQSPPASVETGEYS